MPIIETEIWKANPDRPGTVIFDSQRKARDIFVELKEHLKADGRLPDEYFLFSDKNWGQGALFPKDAYIYCVTDYGGSEGIYIDIYAKYEKDVYEYNNEKKSGEYVKRMVTESFATGKTLGESLEDMDKMNLVAASVTAAFYGNVREFAERYARIATGEEARLYPPRRDNDNHWEQMNPVKNITAEDILKKLEESFGLPAAIAKNGDFVLDDKVEKDKLYPENAEIEIFKGYQKDKERGIGIAFHIHYLDDYGKEYRDWFGSGITDREDIINTTLANDFLKEKPEDIMPDKPNEEDISKIFTLPEKAENNDRVIKYFTKIHKIDSDIINGLIKWNKLYQSKENDSAIFISYDGNKNQRSAQQYNTHTESALKNCVIESDMRYNFTLMGNPDSNRVFLFENPLDSLIHATAFKNNGLEWASSHRISLYVSYNDLSFDNFLKFLRENPQIKNVTLCVPTDKNNSTEFANTYFRNMRYEKNEDISNSVAINFAFMSNIEEDMQRYKKIHNFDISEEDENAWIEKTTRAIEPDEDDYNPDADKSNKGNVAELMENIKNDAEKVGFICEDNDESIENDCGEDEVEYD